MKLLHGLLRGCGVWILSVLGSCKLFTKRINEVHRTFWERHVHYWNWSRYPVIRENSPGISSYFESVECCKYVNGIYLAFFLVKIILSHYIYFDTIMYVLHTFCKIITVPVYLVCRVNIYSVSLKRYFQISPNQKISQLGCKYYS